MKFIFFIILSFNSLFVFSQILPTYQGSFKHHSSSESGVRLFTNCGKTGENGPSQSDCNTAYASTDLSGEVTVINGVQLWTAPTNATYTIAAYGAQGGSTDNVGGKGAKMLGDFSLNQGDVIFILVGQQGLNSDNSNYSYEGRSSNDGGGGGGGSFVVKGTNHTSVVINDILIILNY